MIKTIQKQTNINVDTLSHSIVRKLFTEFSDYNLNKIPYCGQPDFNALEDFIIKYKCYTEQVHFRTLIKENVQSFLENIS